MAEQPVKVKIKRGFLAVMSHGDNIPLDPEEVELVQQGAQQGAIVRVKQGLINPSFLVSITEDKKRYELFLDDTRHEPVRRAGGLVALADILAKHPLQIGAGH